MLKYPRCKINIGLHLTERRSDGFHNIETLFVDLPNIVDILEIVEADNLSLTLSGEKIDGDSDNNLVMRAYRLLAADHRIPPAEMHLHKRIAVGTGLGGGSSDAASALILLNEFFKIGLGRDELVAYALQLGSDCPFFVYTQYEERESPSPMLACGRGEILTPITVPQLEGAVIKLSIPPVRVSTAEAYKMVTPCIPNKSLQSLLEQPIEKWRGTIINDFEKPIFAKYPVIEAYKSRMYNQGAIYASMSGSGSAVFGIFKTQP